ncbi:MAG: agmatinase family protein [Candidatus Competibacteraceae bacterium]|nr:agmatinase family protein [Candidatus Competibacteraceae bacterium]
MASKQKLDFNPDAPASAESGIFGLPYTLEEAALVLIPVPWDVTVSYAAGTAKGPDAIRRASAQVDLFLQDVAQAWDHKIFMLSTPIELKKRGKKARKYAQEYIDVLTKEPDKIQSDKYKQMLAYINAECAFMNNWVQTQATTLLQTGKKVALIGGDHSTPLGLIKALAEKETFSILHIDAHADLRQAYENFTYSHASIIYNTLPIKNIKRIVQVGIRDWCQAEQKIIDQSKGRIVLFTDENIKNEQYSGIPWHQITDKIIANLTDKVYITFDIDGLDPKLCPGTGTPVPGGLEFYEALYLIKKIRKSGKQIIGFDVVEVSPRSDEWDANTGARLIYQIANQLLINTKTQKTIKKPKR